MKESIDVVVVGAGPVGLLAAIELRLAGAGVLVLERLAAPSLVLKAGGIGVLAVEALQRRGMAAEIEAAGTRAFAAREASGAAHPHGTRLGPRYSGHFAGLALIRSDTQKEPGRRPSPTDQQAVEAMLAVRARALGIEVRRECDVAAFVQDADDVDVTWVSPAGEGRIRCAYLVGCDGGRSTIRKMAGFAFPGWDPTLTMYQAIASVDHPERLQASGFCYTVGGMYMSFLGRLIMIDFSGPPADRQAPVTHEEFETVLRRVSGADVRLTSLENASRWTDHTRLVDTYRRGRVLLAGDAAHIHSPFGGQGMSLGLVDAQNLGWKLAAVVRGAMPDSLLDTYTAERRPVAEAVLANTLAQVAIMRPDAQSGAMRDLVARLMEVDAANRFFGEMMSGVVVRYDLGSEREDVGRLVGDRPVGEGVSLYGLMQEGAGVLLDASPGGAASKLVGSKTERIRCTAVDTGPSLLIRPDGCVAWAGDGDSVARLEDAVCRWFGPEKDAQTVRRCA